MENMVELLRHEIVQVMGCTEPAAVAFALATAREQMGVPYDPRTMRVELALSREVLRNASTAVVPILNRRGIKHVAAAGLSASAESFNLFPSMDLEVVRALLKRRNWLAVRAVNRKELFVQATIFTERQVVCARIEGRHDVISHCSVNGECVCRATVERLAIPDMAAIDAVARLRLPELEAVAQDFILRQVCGNPVMPFDLRIAELIRARMSGSPEPVMTITGSGNQGIFIGVPLYELYQERGRDALPAAVLALLVQVHLSDRKRRISNDCGLACKAAPALAAALAFDRGADLREIGRQMRAVARDLREMKCRGALPGCGAKGMQAYRVVMRRINLLGRQG